MIAQLVLTAEPLVPKVGTLAIATMIATGSAHTTAAPKDLGATASKPAQQMGICSTVLAAQMPHLPLHYLLAQVGGGNKVVSACRRVHQTRKHATVLIAATAAMTHAAQVSFAAPVAYAPTLTQLIHATPVPLLAPSTAKLE